MIGIPLVLCLFASTLVHSIPQLSEEDIKLLLHTPKDSKPEYEIVPIHHNLHKRGIDEPHNIKLRAFDYDIVLYLRPGNSRLANEDLKVWGVSYDESIYNFKLDQLSYKIEDIGKTFVDESNGASLILARDEQGNPTYEGTIGDKLAIRPVPKQFLSSSFKDHQPDFLSTNYHFVYKVKPNNESDNDIIKRLSPLGNSGNSTNLKAKRSLTPRILYPEVLVAVCPNLYRALGSDVNAAVRYVLAFWNAVDLRFRSMSNPEIRINVPHIVLNLFSYGSPFLPRPLFQNNKKLVNAMDALDIFIPQYFYSQRLAIPLESYDIAFAMTTEDICTTESGQTECDPQTVGLAFSNGACQYHTAPNSWSVGIGEDNAAYYGVYTIAHELAHLLGANHDDDSCLDETQEPFLMSETDGFGPNFFKWSHCSIREMRTYLNSEVPLCLYNRPQRGNRPLLLLPGLEMSRAEICKKMDKSFMPCQVDDCTVLSCRQLGQRACIGRAQMVDGISCGSNGMCLNGECVRKSIASLQHLGYAV